LVDAKAVARKVDQGYQGIPVRPGAAAGSLGLTIVGRSVAALDYLANGECFWQTGHIVFWPSAASIIKRNRRNTRRCLGRAEANRSWLIDR